MVDKPGCTTLNQLEDLKRTVKKTGKIWSVNFSERFHVAAVAKAEELVAEDKIGKSKTNNWYWSTQTRKLRKTRLVL
jgi:predicted dehydrogenase